MQWTTGLAPWTVNELRADARCRVTFHTIRLRKKEYEWFADYVLLINPFGRAPTATEQQRAALSVGAALDQH